jgi:ribose 5-phosphate isomerase A
MASDPSLSQKRAAALAAVAEVEDGMVVGLGTGSTAAFVIEELGRRVAGGLTIRAVPTSLATASAAAALGIAVIDLPPGGTIDLGIDGIDEIDPELRAIKGAGGALLREKVVATAARRMLAIGDASKPVAALGAKPVPLEILAFARALIEREVVALGGLPVLRTGGQEAVRTDQGNLLLDCRFGALADPAGLGAALSAIPGVLGHGLFVTEIHALYIGTPDGRATKRERSAPGANSCGSSAHP